MYISKVVLGNIRGFHHAGGRSVNLDLRRLGGQLAGWTVLAGRNGAGKSTLLKAAALASAGFSAARGLQQSFAGWISKGEGQAIAVVELIPHEEDRFNGQLEISTEKIWLGIGWIEESGPEPSLKMNLMANADIFELSGELTTQEILERGPWASNPAGWFIVGYGPHRRLSGHAFDVQRLMGGPLPIARLVNLFREDASLIEGVQWLRELHLRRLEDRAGASDLLEDVLRLLDDHLLPETQVEKVDSEGLWVKRGALSLPLLEMSDGYRTVVALVLDLVRQLHVTYGTLKMGRRGGNICVDHRGVVLIDEVELHLHVSWQRRIGFWLKEHFPNIQFIVTTHSPFVCQAADCLIRLPSPGENRKAERVSDELYKTVVNGTVDEAVLTELFGLEHVHSEKSEQLREQVAQLEARIVEGEATPEEREELERLAAQLPNTGSALVDRAVRKFGLDK